MPSLRSSLWLALPLLTALGALAGACSQPAAGMCMVDSECDHNGVIGACIDGQCAVPSHSCDSGWTFLESPDCVPPDEVPDEEEGEGGETEGESDAGGDGDGDGDALTCGDGVLDPGEACDDGDDLDGDGCDSDCNHTPVVDLVTGNNETCVIFEGGQARCFGRDQFGVLGYGADVGSELLAPMPDLPSGLWSDEARPLFGGGYHPEGDNPDVPGAGSFACFLIDNVLSCVGENGRGQLGRQNNIPSDDINGTKFASITAEHIDSVSLGQAHACAIRDDKTVVCWGDNEAKQIGVLWDSDHFGDEPAEHLENIAITLKAGPMFLAAGGFHNCAVLEPGDSIQCWGDNSRGQLGTPGVLTQFADEAAVTKFPGRLITQIAAGAGHTCALFEDGGARCWGGEGQFVITGNHSDESKADDALDVGDVAVNDDVRLTELASGAFHVCALSDEGTVYCWGRGTHGATGLGHSDLTIVPERVDVGEPVVKIAAGQHHTCALRDDNRVVCWGFNGYGQLGTGDKLSRGLTPDTEPTFIEPIEFE